MNIRNLIGPFLLAAGLMLLFRLFWGWYGGANQIQTGFIAPISQAQQEPLYLEIDFKDEEKETQARPVTIATNYGSFSFSHEGATVSEARFTRFSNGNTQEFVTIGQETKIERESRAFLVAFDEKTPYYYTLKNVVEDQDKGTVRYTAYTDFADIEKTFVVSKETHSVELVLTVNPHAGQTVRPRIVWPSPYLDEIKNEDLFNAVSFNKIGKFVKTSSKKLDERWVLLDPEMFGSENKYFVHSMVTDIDNFTYRAYYKVMGNRLLSFLEAKPVTKKTTWKVSYYLGPKELKTIMPVAPRLEKTLDYGFFSPLAKLMLYLLNLINKYVNNYGFAILFITLLLKLCLLPFTFRGEQKMKKMQEYQKRLVYLKQKYKNDPQGLARAQEELIQTHGLPGMGGCLPLFLQMPFFAGLYSALSNSIELHHAPFIFWIKDLSMPDPYKILPLCIALSVLLSSLASQQKNAGFKQVLISLALATFLGAWTASMAAGLALFIFANAFLHFVQTKTQRALGL